MKKNISIPIPIVFILLLVGGYFYIIYSLNQPPEFSPEIVSLTEERVTEFLINERGYQKEEILEVKSIRDSKSKYSKYSLSGYFIYVTFVDEPETSYTYQIIKDVVYQYTFSGVSKKHLNLDVE